MVSETEVTRPYRGVPAEERRAERRAKLITALLDLLAEGGMESVSIRAVSDRAQLTRRYFYENFADLDALLAAAFDEVNAEIVTALFEASTNSDAGTAGQARAALAAGLGVVTTHKGKARLIVASTTTGGALADRRIAAVDALAAVVRAEAIRSGVTTAIPDRLLDTAAILLVGGVTELIARWLSGSIATSKDQLVDDCAQLISLATRVLTS